MLRSSCIKNYIQVEVLLWRCQLSFFKFPLKNTSLSKRAFLLLNKNLQVKFHVTPTTFIYISRHTLISMRMSEGREALWLQCGGQDATLSLPCFLLGVVDCSWVTSSTPAKSPASGAAGLPTAFITRSYLLFHSRLIRAGGETTKRKSKKSFLREPWITAWVFLFFSSIMAVTFCNTIPAAPKALRLRFIPVFLHVITCSVNVVSRFLT